MGALDRTPLDGSVAACQRLETRASFPPSGTPPASAGSTSIGRIHCSTQAPNARVAAFLGKFDAALAAGDIDAAVAMFGAESYWRDLVAFTWNIKTMEGRDQVRDMLVHCLKQTKPRDWRVAEGEVATEADGVLESWISFETEIARGYGLIRIKDGAIWTLLTTMAELKGHEEKAGFTRPARREARRQPRRQDLEGIAGRGG